MLWLQKAIAVLPHTVEYTWQLVISNELVCAVNEKHTHCLSKYKTNHKISH